MERRPPDLHKALTFNYLQTAQQVNAHCEAKELRRRLRQYKYQQTQTFYFRSFLFLSAQMPLTANTINTRLNTKIKSTNPDPVWPVNAITTNSTTNTQNEIQNIFFLLDTVRLTLFELFLFLIGIVGEGSSSLISSFRFFCVFSQFSIAKNELTFVGRFSRASSRHLYIAFFAPCETALGKGAKFLPLARFTTSGGVSPVSI